MIVDRPVTPRSKLGFVRAVNGESAMPSLGPVLDLGKVAEREVYEALDWLLTQQARIENGLARRHLKGGALVLYDAVLRWIGRFGIDEAHGLLWAPPSQSNAGSDGSAKPSN